MAQSRKSTPSSGYYSNAASTTASPTLNPHYLCNWLESCNGQHEFNQCDYWKSELRGKKGIYYSPVGTYELFTQDPRSSVNLEHNNTGCTKVHILVYNVEKKEVLFGLRRCGERKGDRQKRLLLAFPSAEPCRRNERMFLVPSRAFQWLTTDTDFANQCLEQGLKNRFVFHNANAIYPIHLTNEQAFKLTQNFRRNEEFQSLHWLSLSKILSQLPPWPNYIKTEKTYSELAQIQDIKPTGIQVEEHELWYMAAVSLMCIREHVPGGFETFLKV